MSPGFRTRTPGALLLAALLFAGCQTPRGPHAPAVPPSIAADAGPALSAERSAQLEALGYFDRAPTTNPGEQGVTVEAPVAAAGFNLYGSRQRAEAHLIDLEGRRLHSWSAHTTKPAWMHLELLPNGDLLVIAKNRYLARLDWNSDVLWRRELPAHHDLAVDDTGRILVLTHRLREYRHGDSAIPIMDDAITVLSPGGEVERETPLFPLLRDLVPRQRLDRIARELAAGAPARKLITEGAPADVLHTNSIQLLDQPIPGIAPAGSILLSSRELNRISVIDPGLTRRLWEWGRGELEEQHHATLHGNGNILLFDNGVRRKRSRVIEVDPLRGAIAWQYTAPGFYSRLRGAAQPLPNGHVLVTESDRGRAFEVDRDGTVVWEFWNPDVRSGDEQTRAVIYRLTRYPMGYLASELESRLTARPG